MSFQTKIVQKTSGLNIANGTPSCVVSGSDTCDIRVSIYTDAVGGSQLWTETHSNVELGATGGVISLSLNSVTANWGFTWGADDTIYLQLELDQDGNGDFSSAETFARKLISTVPFAYYADRAGSINGLTENDLVQLKPGTTQTTGNTSNPIIDINEDGSGTPDLLKLGVGGSGNRLTLSNAGLLTIADDLTINGDALTTGSTTFNLLNTTATTINFGGAATTLNLAGGSGSTGCTINSAGDLTCSGAISGTGAAGFVLGGNSFGALGILGTNDANALAFETNNVERMRLTTTGGLILGATSSISDLHVQTGEYTSGAITMSASSASTTFTTSSSITLNAGDTVVPIGFESQARTVASTATGTSFSVTQAFGANVSGLQFRIVRRGVTVEGALPVLSLNRVNSGYTSQEWLLRVGGTSAGSRLFDIYSQTTGVTGLAIDQTGDVFIGATTNHGGLANNSRLFVYGGDNGANIDIMGDGSVVDEARVEVQSSDYSTSFASAALDYYGVNGVGTLLGYNKQYMGVLDFRDGTLQAIIKTGGNIPLRFATNDTEVGRFEAAGDLTLNNDLAVNGGDLTTTQTTFNLVNSTATTINFGGAATTMNIGVAGASGTLNLMGGSSSTGCSVNGTTGAFTCTSSGTFGTSITTASTSFDLINTTATTVNFAGAATAVNIGIAGGSGNLNLMGGTGSSGCSLDGATGAFACNSTGTFGGLISSASNFDLVNTVATTINFGGAATTMNIGIAGTSGTLNLMGGYSSTGCTVDGTSGNISCSANVSAGTSTSTAFINAAAATSAKASLRLVSSAGTNPSSPNSGDLWWNGTNLQFRTASATVDLLAPSFTIANDSLDFDKFSDTLSLDANTSIALSTFSLSTSGTGALNFASTGQVTFAGNVDATNGLDITGANLTVGGTGVVATNAGALTTTGLITGGNSLTITTGATNLGGTLTVSGDAALNGDDLTTTQTTFNLLNATATTINFGGAATTMNIGVAGASGTLNLMGGSGSTGCTINGTTGALTCTGAITGSQSFIELGPSSAQAYTGANALINLNETGGSTPDLLNLTVGGSNRFNITNDGRLDVDTGTISSAAAAFSFAATINSQATGMRVALNSSPGSAVPVAGLNVPVTLSGTSALGHGISSSVTSSGTVSQYLNGGSFTSSITGGSISDARGLFSRVTNGGSSTVASIYGLLAEAVGGSSTGGTTNAYGVWGETNTASTGSGTVSNGYGFYSRVGTGATSAAAITTAYNYYGTLNVQSASITTGYGIYLAAADTGGGSLTSYTGLHIADQTSVTGTTGYGVYIAGAKTLSLFVDSGDSRFDGNLTTGSTSIDLFNTTATTINFGGAATAMTIGISGASGTLDLMGGYGSTGCTLNGTNGGWSCDGAIVANNGFTTGGLAYFGNSSSDYTPTAGNWSSTGSTLVLNALNYSVLAFHDNGSRVDFIRVGAGTMELGYNGGYGNPTVVIPGAVNIATASTGAVNIGTGATTQTLNFGTGAGAKTVSIGSNTSGSTTTIYAGDTASNGTFILTGVTKLNRNSYLCIGAGNGIVNYNSSCTSSSIRFKENVVNLNYGLEEIMALRPVFFNYKPDQNLGNRRNIGFIAEEVNEIIPEVTVFGEDGLVESLDYEKLVSLLTVGVQQLNTNIQALETNINSELASLRVSIENLATPDLSAITSQIDSQQLRISNLEARVENLEAGVISSLVLPGTAEFGELVITGKVNVKGQLLLSNKNIGITTIATGSTEKTITFAQGFPNSPVVIAIPTQSSIGYSIQDTTTTGFKIVLDAPAASDLQFNWFVSSGE